MDSDIQAGDVVVKARGAYRIIPLGTICRVITVNVGPRSGKLGLVLRGWQHSPTTVGFAIENFDKLRPAEDCFSEAMRNLLPRIPELEPITVEIRQLDPEIWGASAVADQDGGE